ncbi:hypothetical protein [Pararhizobium sp. A13]|uniref:type II toxin-antitoxin system VapC family toxin n=1 Tax=Pararhizobium sp. A13 TaxID=3133975 RepID=UPI00324D595D
MKFLLDTHALLWWLSDDPLLSQTAREIIADPSHEIYVSAASAWGDSDKGKLPTGNLILPDFSGVIAEASIWCIACFYLETTWILSTACLPPGRSSRT